MTVSTHNIAFSNFILNFFKTTNPIVLRNRKLLIIRISVVKIHNIIRILNTAVPARQIFSFFNKF